MKRFRRIILAAAIVIASRRSLESLVICLREIVYLSVLLSESVISVRTLLFVIFHTRPVGRTNETRRFPNESIPLLQRE